MMNKMYTVFLGDIKNGRLMRLSYLGYCFLLVLLFIGLLLITIIGIGVGEELIGGDLQQAQDTLREWFTFPFLIIFGALVALLTYASVNITAKRIRDTGLPGWWVVLAIIILEAIVSFAISPQAGSGLHHLIWVLLLLIPPNAFAKKDVVEKE